MPKLLQRRATRQGEDDVVSKDLADDAERQNVPLPNLYGEGAQVALKARPTRLFGMTIEEPGVVVITGSQIAADTACETVGDDEPSDTEDEAP